MQATLSLSCGKNSKQAVQRKKVLPYLTACTESAGVDHISHKPYRSQKYRSHTISARDNDHIGKTSSTRNVRMRPR